MADLILGPLVDVTVSKVISVTTEQLNLAVGFKQELKKFRMVLRMLRGVLQDAEQKNVTSHYDLQDWLKELGNIVDEADNVVDEIAYEHLRYQVAQKQMWKKVSYFFTLSNPLAFRLKIANRIKNLSLDLADLNAWATGLGLQYRLANKLPEHIEIQQTDSSLGDPSKIVGRADKVREVVQLLIDSSNDQRLRVVSIVGMGGIGKTAMAKLVCNNEQIRSHFFKVLWVCVSENFDVKRILTEMLQAFDGNVSVDVSQENVVQKLGEILKGKNYLLILDDVWNEDRQQREWESLRSSLLGIGKDGGRRVLVTTRGEDVASTMGTLTKHIHRLEGLEVEDCWSIIKQRVFVSSSFHSELEEIGREIARKCGGVALAANVIGGILCNKRDRDFWLSVKNDEVWRRIEQQANGVLPVLQLSFNRLPTPALKQCFAFCSIFPKDFVMEKEMLIQLWMAEGFLQPFSERHSEMEDIGDEYFNALFSCSLFQDAERDSYGCIIACKMHDLVHDLAQSVSKSQTLILEDGRGRNILPDIRHLNVIFDMVTATKLGDATKKLHTLFSTVDVFHSLSTNLRKVRVLSVHGVNIDELPAFLGKMKHLRFLDVSETRIKELPKFITKLYHLQTFRFMNCKSVKRPLEGIWDLVNLRHIYFNDEELMPAGIGRLTCLKTLQLFVVGRQKGHQIEELGCLSQLRGKLEIRKLSMVRDKVAAEGAKLSEKATIQELQLLFGGESNVEDRCKHDEDILKGLQPHSNLKGLTVENYCGKSCPLWMSEVNVLKNLVFMTFYKCPYLEKISSLLLSNEAEVKIKCCKNLKSIADLSLQKLIIEECEELVRVEVGLVAMKSLKEVHIRSCGKLQRLEMLPLSDEAEVKIRHCTNLKSIADSSLQKLIITDPSLQKLIITSCEELVRVEVGLVAMKSVKEVHIKSCGKLQCLEILPSLQGLSSLQKIDILWCGELKSIGKSLSTLTSLKELIIHCCDGLTSLSSLHGLSSLQKIKLSHCRKLRSTGDGLPTLTGLKKLIIRCCDGLTSLPSLHGLSSLQKIKISSCRELKSIGENLQGLSSLQKIELLYCGELKSIGESLQGLSSLQKINISYCRKLKSIGESLSTLTSLKEFIIQYCTDLTSLPSLHGLSSLQKIELSDPWELQNIEESLSTLTSLKELIIRGCNGLTSLASLHGLSSLQNIGLYACRELKSIGESLSTSTSLKKLIIRGCGLTSLPSLHGLSSLQNIELSCCGELKSIGESLSTLTSLKELIIWGCDGLMSLPSFHGLSSLQSLSIERCGGLRSLPSGLPSCTALEELAIADCDHLISIPDDLRSNWSIRNPACLARLKKLTIGGFSTELQDFPDLRFIGSSLEELTLFAWGKPRERLLDQIQHLTALRDLKIRDFDELETLPLPNWFGNLSSLQTLKISNCKSLKHMEAIRCLSKLESLEIDECPELKERCARGSGSEWDYISHIPNIEIDREWIQRNGAPVEVPNDDSEQDDDNVRADDNEQDDDQDDDGEQDDDNEQDDDPDDDDEQLPARVIGLRRFICCKN